MEHNLQELHTSIELLVTNRKGVHVTAMQFYRMMHCMQAEYMLLSFYFCLCCVVSIIGELLVNCYCVMCNKLLKSVIIVGIILPWIICLGAVQGALCISFE